MKTGFIFVLYKTPSNEILRLKKEVKNLKINDLRLYFIDNSNNGLGYAAGANLGIKKAQKDNFDLFVVANPDISLKKISSQSLFDASKHFDIWGLTMKQQGKIYYGGQIDRWRMHGGLIEEKPKKRFITTDFVSGSLMFIIKNIFAIWILIKNRKLNRYQALVLWLNGKLLIK